MLVEGVEGSRERCSGERATARCGRGRGVATGGGGCGGSYSGGDRRAAVPSEPVPTAVDQAAVVDIPDDDTPSPGWVSGRTGLR
jgi:hypothetical protein